MSGVANLILMGGRRRVCLTDVSNFETPVSKKQVSAPYFSCFLFLGKACKMKPSWWQAATADAVDKGSSYTVLIGAFQLHDRTVIKRGNNNDDDSNSQ